jgi:glutamate carboxypeptidase
MSSAANLLDQVAALVECESPSADLGATAACAKVLEDLVADRLGARAQWHEVDGRSHLRWMFGTPRVLLIGHLDTVWPLGTLARWPFAVDGDRATGPGVFDMKAGLVQMFSAVATLDDLDGVSILVTSDEEIGSTTSRALIEESATGVAATLVFEPSQDSALKVARKGVGLYTIDVEGRAAHAGLEPERGINATLEVARQAIAVASLSRPDIGTTVTPTVVSGGTTVNTVPAAARLCVDVRASSVAEMDRVGSALASLQPTTPGAVLEVRAEGVRAPFEVSTSADLFATAQRLATDLGLDPLHGVTVGGGSDGNITAALGVPTLDGLGAVGGGAHAEGEWMNVSQLVPRTQLAAALVTEVLNRESRR